MPTPERDLTKRLAALERQVRELSGQLERSRRAVRVPRPLTRLAKTWTESPGAYPSDPDTTVYPIVFLDVAFTATPGVQAATETPHHDDSQVAALNWTGREFLARGTKVEVLEHQHKHYIVGVVGGECDVDEYTQCCFTFNMDPADIPGFDEDATHGQVLSHLSGCLLWRDFRKCTTSSSGEEETCTGECQFYFNGAAWEKIGDTCAGTGCTCTEPPITGNEEAGDIMPGTCE